MRQLLLPTLLLLCQLGLADTLTVSNYVSSAGFQQETTSGLQVGWFEMPSPGYIERIDVNVGGQTGTIDLYIYGHEGGIPWPEANDPLLGPITLSKTATGQQWLTYELPVPLFIEGDQFFVGFDNMSPNVRIRKDLQTRSAQCASALGGDRYFQYFFNGTNWSPGTEAFLIDVRLDLDDTSPANHFTDVTNSWGFNNNFGQERISVADLDNDGWPDAMINGQLYINELDNSGQFIYSTNTKNIRPNARAHVLLDSDNDGDLDILALQYVDSTSTLYINDSAGNFTAKNLNLPAFPAINSVSVADMNNDNYPDFVVGQLWLTYPDDLPKYVFYNTGANDWADSSQIMYTDTFYGVSRGSQFTDYNDDGLPDLFVANYVTALGKQESPRDELWRNNGDGSFTNVISGTGIDTTEGNFFWNYSSGCAWEDFDNDGDMDLFAPTLSHPRNMNGNSGEFTRGTQIYRNEGSGQPFTELDNSSTGFLFEETHAGAATGDLNNDGLTDVFFTAFYECRYADLYIQQPSGSFSLESYQWGVDRLDTEQDAVLADLDNDGDLDLLAGQGEKIRVFRNDFSNSGNYIKLQAIANTKNHFALGAKIKVYAAGEVFTREVIAGQSQKMQRPYMQHFGLGAITTIDSVTVQWPGPDAHRNVYAGLVVNQSYILEEFPDTTPITSIDEIALSQGVDIYPNPAREAVFISLPSIESEIALSISDGSGRIVLNRRLDTRLAGTDYYLPVDALANGLYHLSLSDRSNGVRYSGKFLKLGR